MNIVVLSINIIVFVLFGIDKFASKQKGRRIPEAVLLVLSFFFGANGAALGMILFNHKSNKMLFRILVPLFVIVNYILFIDSFNVIENFLSAIVGIFSK
ncbi:MAG: DUF1294 domain-containing protein [Ruminococcaceae bacterium]|nr:DUF1294 domain-containing protein [Oscillospiraceae bacterium]